MEGKVTKHKIIVELIITTMIIILLFVSNSNIVFAIQDNSNNNSSVEETEKEFCYLSDISYESGKTAWGKISLDKASDDSLITLTIEGTPASFKKGIFAHATSELIYNIGDYNYDYFTTYYGVNTTSGNRGNGVKFYIYTSTDGTEWTLQTDENPVALKSSDNAIFVKINIKGAKYLKLYANDNGANGNDHSAYGDAKLIKEGYSDNITKTVEEYDEIIKNEYTGQDITGNLELTLLQRTLIKNVGQYRLKTYIEESELNKETFEWLMNDIDSLRLYIVGGKPDGSYLNSLRVLSQLYDTYKKDLQNENVTENGIVLKDLYRRMIIALSLTHSTTVGLWTGPKTDVNSSNAVNRYAIYKTMHEKGLLRNEIFESLTIEEMRWVMNNIIDDEEIEWLNAYSTKKGSTNPYSYIKYGGGYNYLESQYYDKSQYEKWNEKYGLSEYNISYKEGYPKLWIVFEEGAVCGGISKTGSNLYGSYGIPSTVVSQPGHAAYIFYSQNENGDGIWNLYNDVSGWANSSKTEVLSIRMPNDWGSGNYATYTESVKQATYILLAQAAQNEYEKYEKAEEILLLEDVYKDNKLELYKIYRKALEAEPINFDAWYGLVNLYISDNTKTEQDYYNLAEEIAETLTYYPLPMYDLIRIIQPKLTSPKYSVKFSLLELNTLTNASKATDNESIQANAVKAVANALLGIVDTSVATFSFDGENAGSIVLSDKYEGIGVRWDYSIDGGKTWKDTNEHILKLEDSELSSITTENDIKIHIVGVSYEEENIYTIDITKFNNPNVYNNDLENKVIGATDLMEWKLSNEDKWTSFAESEPDLTGDKVIEVRIKNSGTKLNSDSVTLNYTEDNQPDTQKYIPIKHLSISEVSSEATGNNGHAKNAIDGNINTIWHTAYDGSDTERFITIKLDEPVYLSKLQYVPRQSGSNGRIKDGKLLVSMDGENWKEATTILNWENNAATKEIVLEESIQTQYVKLVTTSNYGDGRNFSSALMINLFEDITKKTTILGDLDGDGEITINDIAMLKLYLIHSNVEDIDYNIADMDQDNEITINDLAIIKLMLIGLMEI